LDFAFKQIVNGPDKARAEQVRGMVRDDGWEYAAEFCAHLLQVAALNLRPWECPPCSAVPGGSLPESKLLDKLIAGGYSKFYHDPTEVLVGPRPVLKGKRPSAHAPEAVER
jgi:hypothetical protein